MWSANSENLKNPKIEDVSISETGKTDHNLTDKTQTQSENVDSGFLSGPQLYLDEEDLPSSAVPTTDKSQNLQPTPHPKEQQIEQNYIDSGCIEEEDIVVSQIGDKAGQMILESGADSGLTEWFCNLSLKNSNQPLNNLGATGGNSRKSAKDASNITKENKGNQDSWEIYYKQNNDGDTQLHLACITGYVDVIAALIRMAPHPCLFNIQNDEAQTGLHLAVLTGQPRIVRMLLLAGAEPIVRDRNGNTPLHLASGSGDLQCVKALTIPISASEIQEAHRLYGHRSTDKTVSYLRYAELPADLEIRNYEGERCVHLAAQGGHIEVLRHLVWFGADINAREGKSGRTPLHIAIECCNEVLANFLLEECSKLNLETATYAGLTAYQVACILNNSRMQNNLEKRGAEPLTPPDSDIDSSDNELDLDDSQIYDRFGDPGFFVSYNGGNPINVA